MNWYYFTFVFCEILNVILLIVIWSITDQFLSGNFHNYGSEVFGELVTGEYGELATNDDKKFNVMCNAFPTAVILFINCPSYLFNSKATLSSAAALSPVL